MFAYAVGRSDVDRDILNVSAPVRPWVSTQITGRCSPTNARGILHLQSWNRARPHVGARYGHGNQPGSTAKPRQRAADKVSSTLFNIARLITMRCTSDEPSPISHKRASRQ